MKVGWFVFAATILVSVGALFFGAIAGAKPAPLHGSVMNPPFNAPNFQLVDQNGNSVQLSDLQGHAVLLYFGYTHCPDECPRAMATYKQVRLDLGSQAGDARFLFVSVDPARDTPAVVGQFLQQFDPAIIGLTGSQSQLAPVWKAYGIYQDPTSGKVSHSDQLFLIDTQGRMRTIYPNDVSASIVESDLRTVMKGG